MAAEDAEQVRREVAGLEAGEAEPQKPGDAAAEFFNESGEGRRIGLGGLETAEGGGPAIGAEEDAGEDDFAVSGIDESTRLGDGVVDGFAPEGGTQFGDDAVGAVGVAAVLNFQEGALPAGLVFAQEREGDRGRNVVDNSRGGWFIMSRMTTRGGIN